MMKTVALAIGLSIGLAFAPTPASAAVKVFLLAGQSNMMGVGMAADLPPAYANQTNVNFWYNGQWDSLHGSYDGWGQFGPEITFGYTLKNSILPGDSIYLVKYAVGGSSLAVDWNPDGTGSAYTGFKSTVNAAMQNLTRAGLSPSIAGMIWMQGESDTGPPNSLQYAANLKNFITTVRHDVQTPEMPFVVGCISTYWGSEADNDLVRTAQMTVPGQVGHATWIDTKDLERWPDGGFGSGHYDTQGQIDLGIRFADAVTILPEPSALMLLVTGLLGSLFCYAWRKRA